MQSEKYVDTVCFRNLNVCFNLVWLCLVFKCHSSCTDFFYSC